MVGQTGGKPNAKNRSEGIKDLGRIVAVEWKRQVLSSVRGGLVTKTCLTPQMVVHQAPLSMEFARQEYWSGQLFASPGKLPKPGTEPRSPASQANSLLSEPPGKPKNTGVGSLFLLQGIFLTQELNRGLLYYRQILYQLSYQEIWMSINKTGKSG